MTAPARRASSEATNASPEAIGAAESLMPNEQGVVESRDPATGEVWRRYMATAGPEVARAVELAHGAQPAWAAQPLRERLRVIDAFHAALYRRRLEAADLISRESGKPVPEALAAEVLVALDLARFVLSETPRVVDAPWYTPQSLAMWRKRVRLARQPWGVVGVISPWNYPFMLPAGVVLPLLATGNAVVLKPSELTPSTGAFLAELLAEARLPGGVLAVVQGDGATGAHLTRAAVQKVFFTGSVGAGRKVAAACAERLVPCQLELGGSDAAIVLADADVAHAASGILWGRFANAGQTCLAPKRVFVEAPAYEPFLAALRERVTRLRVGATRDGSADVGPLIRPRQLDALEAQRDDATRSGAQASPGPASADATLGSGPFFAPTVVTGAPVDAVVWHEETFGPLLPVMRVVDADEAVMRANASAFGLSASVWSANRRRAIAVAERLVAGSVMINDAVSIGGIADVPHGGTRASGIGRSHGAAGIEECVRVQAVVDDRFVRWRQPWWFGYTPGVTRLLDGFARFAHGRTLLERLRGLPGVVRLLFRPDRPV